MSTTLLGSLIRWDGNIPENVIFRWEGPNLYTRYAYRQFIRPDATPYWYTSQDPLNIEGELEWSSDNLIDVWTFVWYPERVSTYDATPYTLIDTIGAQLDNNGNPPTKRHVDKSNSPTITLGGTGWESLAELWIRVSTPGARGTAEVEVSLNEGATWETPPIVTSATPQAIPTTSATMAFDAGTYQADAVYRTVPYASEIWGPASQYLDSANKSLVKFNLLILRNYAAFPFEDDPYANFEAMLDFWIALFADPQYDKIGNSPVVYLYAGSGNADAQWDQARILQFQAAAVTAGFDEPYFVFINCPLSTIQSHEAAGVVNTGRTNYGGPQKAGPAGHNPYSTQVALDVTSFGTQSAARPGVPHLVLCNDPRPRTEASLPYDQWTDEPVRSEMEAHFVRVANWADSNPTKHIGRTLWYALEVGEGGPVMPTAQNGAKFLEAWKAVKSGAFPATYSDKFTTESLHWTVTGTWANVQDIDDAFHFQEIQSTSAGARLELLSSAGIDTVPNWPAPDTVGVRVRGNVNGVRNALIYEDLTLAAGQYKLWIDVVDSSNVEIYIDEALVDTVDLGTVSQVGIDEVEWLRQRGAAPPVATAITRETAARTGAVDAVVALFDVGSDAHVREGTTNLATFEVAYGAASGGSSALSGTPLVEATVASGTADNVLLEDSTDMLLITCGVNDSTCTYSEAARHATLADFAALVDGGGAPGYMVLREGSTPLVELEFEATAWAAPASGAMTVEGTPTGVATAAGTPDNCQFFDGADVLVATAVLTGVGAIASGNTVNATAFTVSCPEAGSGGLTLGRAAVVSPEDMTITSGVLQAAA